MRRLRLLLPLLALPLAAPAGAETLADIRVELGQLAADFNSLKAELTTTGSMASVGGGDALQRMDAIEAELSRLTARAEEIELRLNRVVSDGTNRIGDIEFRLCEATPGCDPLNMPATVPLGGGSAAAATPAPSNTPTASSGGPELAMGEKADFDRAKEVLGQGDFRGAADLFAAFAQTYPGGPLTGEAMFLRGQALQQAGDVPGAARAWLDAFSAEPEGPRAAENLLMLGKSLGDLGQTAEACATLSEVGYRFQAAPAASEAGMAMQSLGCQ